MIQELDESNYIRENEIVVALNKLIRAHNAPELAATVPSVAAQKKVREISLYECTENSVVPCDLMKRICTKPEPGVCSAKHALNPHLIADKSNMGANTASLKLSELNECIKHIIPLLSRPVNEDDLFVIERCHDFIVRQFQV